MKGQDAVNQGIRPHGHSSCRTSPGLRGSVSPQGTPPKPGRQARSARLPLTVSPSQRSRHGPTLLPLWGKEVCLQEPLPTGWHRHRWLQKCPIVTVPAAASTAFPLGIHKGQDGLAAVRNFTAVAFTMTP